MEVQYYIVENADTVEETNSDKGANSHRVSLPVVAGPFDSEDYAQENISKYYHHGQMVVAVHKG